ncbi:MAG: tetratricopeptide repeat protein [Bacteroidetes bacterium]|nr:tetratricopeptide repeat protein [Bacteroidota bacterium]
MKVLAIFILGMILSIDPKKVSKINSLKSEAKKAFLSGDFNTAIEKYKYLKDSLGVSEEEVAMNLANSYFRTNDTTSAFTTYQPLSISNDAKIKSWANQQLGVMANRQGKFEEALNYFKQAMKAEPENEQARFNYEIVKKKLEEQKKQQQQNKDQNKDNKDKKDDQKKDQKDKKDQQNKDQQNKDQKDKQDKKDQENKDKQDQKKDQQNKDQKDKEQKDKEQKEKEQQQKEQEKKDQQNKDEKNKPDPSLSEKLKEMKMSEEKAKMILEAMKNQEVQYLQQNKRKATKPRDRGKPDW